MSYRNRDAKPVGSYAFFPDEDTVNRMMRTTVKLESEITSIKSDISELRETMGSQGEKLDMVTSQARDLIIIKRVAISVLVLLVPGVTHYVVDSIVNSQKIVATERAQQEHLEGPNSGHRETDREIGSLRATIREFRAEEAAERRSHMEYLDRVQKTLERIESRGVPHRRRSR